MICGLAFHWLVNLNTDLGQSKSSCKAENPGMCLNLSWKTVQRNLSVIIEYGGTAPESVEIDFLAEEL